MPINHQQTTGNYQKAIQLFCVSGIFQYLKDVSLDNDNNSPFTRNVSKQAYKSNKTHFTKVDITTDFRN